MAERASWRTLAEMDVQFARSQRRAVARRRLLRPAGSGMRSVRLVLAAAAVFAVVGELGGLDRLAEAQSRNSRARLTQEARPVCPVPTRFRRAFTAAAHDANLPLALLVAVAYEESRMDPAARSHRGAEGLLQLMPATAAELRLDHRVPRTNVLAGARYLRQMLDRFGSLELALAAYNAGPTAVAHAGGAPGGETLTYVANVQRRLGALGTACA